MDTLQSIVYSNYKMLNTLVNVERYLIRYFTQTHKAVALSELKQTQSAILAVRLAMHKMTPISVVCLAQNINPMRIIDFIHSADTELTDQEMNIIKNAANTEGIECNEDIHEFHLENEQLLNHLNGIIKKWKN